MATYDLVGVPYPFNHELFTNDAKLSAIVKRIEDLTEISLDLDDCLQLLSTLRKMQENERNPSGPIGPMEYGIVCDALVAQAVMLYSRIFRSSTGRIRFEASEIFGSDNGKLLQTHGFLIKFRDKHFAHAELRLNRHELFLFPSVAATGKPAANPEGQQSRIILHSSFDWFRLGPVASHVKRYILKSREKAVDAFDSSLSEAQIEFLQKTPKAVMLSKHWRANIGRTRGEI